MAAAPPQHLAGRLAERQALLRAALSILDRVSLQPPGTGRRAPPQGAGAGQPSRREPDRAHPLPQPSRWAGLLADAATMGMTSPPDRRSELGGQRVLVVKDNAVVSMLVEDELLGAGAEVVGPAGRVGDALRLVEEAVRDRGLSAAVLDIDLAGAGVEPVADRLAALGVPFLFATGYGEGRGTGGHADAPVLRKPFGRRALIDAVAALASARG